jgi:hypothetical protein
VPLRPRCYPALLPDAIWLVSADCELAAGEGTKHLWEGQGCADQSLNERLVFSLVSPEEMKNGSADGVLFRVFTRSCSTQLVVGGPV